MRMLTIGALARQAGVTPEAIRYWERLGVLETPARDASGYRRYGPRVLDEVRLLRAAQAVGFTLDDIAGLLALTRSERVACRELCGMAERQLAQLDARIRELRAARDTLAAAWGACAHDDDCTLPAALVALTAHSAD